MKIYLVKSEFGHDTQYHTGEFSREDPPSPYLGNIEEFNINSMKSGGSVDTDSVPLLDVEELL